MVFLDEIDNVVWFVLLESVDNMFNFEVEVVYFFLVMEIVVLFVFFFLKVKVSERCGSVCWCKRGFGYGVMFFIESMFWFDKVVGIILLLRNFIYKDLRGLL